MVAKLNQRFVGFRALFQLFKVFVDHGWQGLCPGIAHKLRPPDSSLRRNGVGYTRYRCNCATRSGLDRTRRTETIWDRQVAKLDRQAAQWKRQATQLM
jgi:hypothetical protein